MYASCKECRHKDEVKVSHDGKKYEIRCGEMLCGRFSSEGDFWGIKKPCRKYEQSSQQMELELED